MSLSARGLRRFGTPHSLKKGCGTEVVGCHLLQGIEVEHFNVLWCGEATMYQQRLEELQKGFEIVIHRWMPWHSGRVIDDKRFFLNGLERGFLEETMLHSTDAILLSLRSKTLPSPAHRLCDEEIILSERGTGRG